jgi:hypothetical protein
VADTAALGARRCNKRQRQGAPIPSIKRDDGVKARRTVAGCDELVARRHPKHLSQTSAQSLQMVSAEGLRNALGMSARTMDAHVEAMPPRVARITGWKAEQAKCHAMTARHRRTPKKAKGPPKRAFRYCGGTNSRT